MREDVKYVQSKWKYLLHLLRGDILVSRSSAAIDGLRFLVHGADCVLTGNIAGVVCYMLAIRSLQAS